VELRHKGLVKSLLSTSVPVLRDLEQAATAIQSRQKLYKILSYNLVFVSGKLHPVLPPYPDVLPNSSLSGKQLQTPPAPRSTLGHQELPSPATREGHSGHGQPTPALQCSHVFCRPTLRFRGQSGTLPSVSKEMLGAVTA